jgi:hypothetical protein
MTIRRIVGKASSGKQQVNFAHRGKLLEVNGMVGQIATCLAAPGKHPSGNK